MTDTRFSVQLHELGDTVLRLADVERELGRIERRVDRIEPRQAGDVHRGVQGFADHWEHGLVRLRSHVGELHDALSGAHEGYTGLEAALAQRFGGTP